MSDPLSDIIIDARVRFWVCPIWEHGERRAVTVRWLDGVAYCTFPGCTRSSADAPRGSAPEHTRREISTGDRTRNGDSVCTNILSWWIAS